MSPSPAGMGELLLLLLVAGHFIGDFALQSERMALRKHHGRVLVPHVVLLALAHLALVAPFLSWPLLGAVGAISISHGLIDVLKAFGRRSSARTLRAFLLDQLAHLVVIGMVWALLLQWMGTPEPRVSGSTLQSFALVGVVAAAFAFNATGGAAIVSGVLASRDPGLEEGSGASGGGRLIGILERTLSLILILAGQWAAIVILVAAKSIARFDELKDRRFSEYYLIGTLASLLVAVLIGIGLMAVMELIRV